MACALAGLGLVGCGDALREDPSLTVRPDAGPRPEADAAVNGGDAPEPEPEPDVGTPEFTGDLVLSPDQDGRYELVSGPRCSLADGRLLNCQGPQGYVVEPGEGLRREVHTEVQLQTSGDCMTEAQYVMEIAYYDKTLDIPYPAEPGIIRLQRDNHRRIREFQILRAGPAEGIDTVGFDVTCRIWFTVGWNLLDDATPQAD
jgi:hypothetical protein